MVAAQEAVRAIQNAVYDMPVSPLCRVYHTASENIDNFLSSCTPLAAIMCKRQHNYIARIIHWALSKRFKQDVCSSTGTINLRVCRKILK